MQPNENHEPDAMGTPLDLRNAGLACSRAARVGTWLAAGLTVMLLSGCSTPNTRVSERPWNQPTRSELNRDVKFWWCSPEWAGFEWDPIRNTPVHWP